MFFKRNDDEFYDWELQKAAREKAAVMSEINEEEEGMNNGLDSSIKVLAFLILLVLTCIIFILAVRYNQAQKRIKELEAERFDIIRFFVENMDEEANEEPYWEAEDEFDYHRDNEIELPTEPEEMVNSNPIPVPQPPAEPQP